MKKILLAAVAAVAMSGAAIAADLPTKGAPVYRAAPQFSWTGFYVGLHGGYGSADFDYTDPLAAVFSRSDDPRGYLFGAQIGYNWQVAPNWVWGVEADYAGASINNTSFNNPIPAFASHTEIDRLASVRVRGGYAWDRNLLYVTGGWGWARAEHSYNVGAAVDSTNETYSGWVLGGGWESAITNNWSLKVEYLYYDLGNGNFATPTTTGTFANTDGKLQTIKFGVNYKFGSY